MAKKRGKIRPKKASGSPVKRAKKAKKPVDEKHEAPDPFSISLKDLEILTEQKKVEKKIGEIENKETSIEKKESAIQAQEKKVEAETEKVERIEKRIEQQVTPKPLKALKFTDINKGIVGAFIGVVAHYAFIYGREIAKDISTTRATLLIIFSYFLIIILMYETGYRQIKEKWILRIIPKRATVIYLTSIVVIIFIFFLFNQLDFSNPGRLYREIAVTLVLASVGAGTADLIGKD